jgi:hypothetical protein
MPRNADYCYALLDLAPDYLALGWLIVDELGPVHGCYSALAVWLCECRSPVFPCRV